MPMKQQTLAMAADQTFENYRKPMTPVSAPTQGTGVATALGWAFVIAETPCRMAAIQRVSVVTRV